MSDNDNKKKGKSVRDVLGLDSKDFLGTGMTFEQWHLQQQLERIQNSYVVQEPAEKKRRLTYVMQLVAEGLRIRSLPNGRFGSAVIEWALEHVMEGDWKGLDEDIAWVNFRGTLAPQQEHERAKYEPAELARMDAQETEHAELWAIFGAMLQSARDTRPRDGRPALRA